MTRCFRIQSRHRDSQLWRIGLVLGLAVAIGCKANAPAPASDPVPSEAPAPAPVAAPTPPPPEPEPEPEPEPLRIAVLLSDQQPQYVGVVEALRRHADAAEVQVYPLDGRLPKATEAVRELRSAGYHNVISVGLLAAKAAQSLDAETVVFCQVFNHAAHDLGQSGIDSLPTMADAAQLLATFGTPTRVGVITGDGHQDRIHRAAADFAAHGIDVVHRVTTSDKETILEFSRMLGDIDGYWLVPDNRVLSRSALRELFSLARQRGVSVLAHDPGFLKLGAVLSVTALHDEIANEALAQLRRGGGAAPSITPLSSSKLQINPDVAAELGISLNDVPQELLAR